jgi:hypothetical protein
MDTKAKKSNRFVDATHLATDGIASRISSRNKPHILIACMPKSGSTFFSNALAECPGFRNVALVPAYGQREQELCKIQLSRHNGRSYVAQHHVRNSDWTQQLISKYGITPVVLVRNLADAAISLRDHIRKESPETAMAFFTNEHLNMNDADLEAAVVRLALPWYLNFYAGWRNDPNALFLNYDEMIVDPAAAMAKVLKRAGVEASPESLRKALEQAKGKKHRFNVGIPGRGSALSPQAAKSLRDLLDSYPTLKADPLFVQTRKTLVSPGEAEDLHVLRS